MKVWRKNRTQSAQLFQVAGTMKYGFLVGSWDNETSVPYKPECRQEVKAHDGLQTTTTYFTDGTMKTNYRLTNQSGSALVRIKK